MSSKDRPSKAMQSLDFGRSGKLDMQVLDERIDEGKD